MIDLSEKIALVTGGAKGAGKGICLALAGQGASVAVADIDEQGASEVASELSARGPRSVAFEIDVTDRASVDWVVPRVVEEFGKIDILVNNAGIVGAGGYFERDEPSDEDWFQVFAVNVRGVVMVSQAVSPHMMERHYGKIVNIASVSARQGVTVHPQYSTSKAAVVNWTQAHALQLARYSINVNAICPGLLWTAMTESFFQLLARRGSGDVNSGREIFDSAVKSTIPLGREQTPEDIGNLAAFLASDDARNITGQAVNLDGGWYMN